MADAKKDDQKGDQKDDRKGDQKDDSKGEQGKDDPSKKQSPEEKMASRFPQKVLVGALIGLPIIDDGNREFATITKVVKTPAGKVGLIVDYGGWFGIWTRAVAVPIEVVAIVGRQVASLDMPPDVYKKAPTWNLSQETVLSPDTTIRIALTRR